MPQIMILLLGILSLGCQKELSTVSPNISSSKSQLINKEIRDTSINKNEENSTQTMRENIIYDIVQDIEGNYTLEKGIISYKNGKNFINKLVTSSDLVIEKLDDDDYGFYLTIQIDNLTPTEEIGIFHKKDNKYFKRIIYSPDVTKDSNVSTASKKLKTELSDEVKITTKDNGIKIDMNINDNEQLRIIWTRDLDNSKFISKELKHAKHEYIETYKERFLKYFKDLPI